MDASQPMPRVRSLASSSNIAITSVFVFLATASVILRLVARLRFAAGMGVDDWIILPALLCCYGLLIVAAVCGDLGGIDYIRTDKSPTEIASIFLKSFYIEPFFVYPALGLVKISVLLFYRRLFFIKKWFVWACWILITITTLWVLSVLIVELNIARPISNAWDPMGELQINFNAFALAINPISIALDVIILCMPLFVIHTLRMTLKQKFITAGILWLGVFCLVADALRLHYTRISIGAGLEAGSVTDRFYIPRQIWLWDRITPCASIVCACLPTYGPLVKGRNLLESMLRSVGSWVQVGRSRQSSDHGSNASGNNSGVDRKGDVPLKKLSSDTSSSGGRNVTTVNADSTFKSNEADSGRNIHVTYTVDLESVPGASPPGQAR